MAVVLIEDKKIWDEFVDESPYAMLTHKWDYLKITEKHTGFKLYTYGFYKGNELLGIYPLFYKRVMGLKTIYSPPPSVQAQCLGFLVSKEYDNMKQSKRESLLNSFLGEIEDEVQKYSPDYMLIYTAPNFLDMRFFKWNNYLVEPMYTYVVDLNQTNEEIWNNLHTDVRRCIRLADGNGLKLCVSDDIFILNERQEKRYKEIAPYFTMDAEYLNELLKAFPDNIKVYYVYNDTEQAISGIVTQEYNGRFFIWMGIAKAAEHANQFLIWKVMERAKSEGYKKFEIWGADNRHLNVFKSRFGSSLEISERVYKKSLMGKVAGWTYLNIYRPYLVGKVNIRDGGNDS